MPLHNITSEQVQLHQAEDAPWDRPAFLKHLSASVTRLTPSEIQFDLVGVDASIANAFRRVLKAEVPAIAADTVYIWNNTSLVQDEVLAQRLGLVPLNIDPRKVEYRQAAQDPTDINTIVFRLVAKCDRTKTKVTPTAPPAYRNEQVLSSMLDWQPKGRQHELFSLCKPAPVNSDILIAKLRPGQEITAEIHCTKGIGKDHAKWSPVATASYRLLPSIQILQPIPSSLCDKFASCFAPGVIQIHQDTHGNKIVKVADPRNDTVSREVLRHPEFEGKVKLGRIPDHFLFSVESTGAYLPADLMVEAGKLLLEKIQQIRRCL